MKKKKLYCYVDESGQDTKGKFFVVSLVITEQERDALLLVCKEVEKRQRREKLNGENQTI